MQGSFQRLRRENPDAAHRLYGAAMIVAELAAFRKSGKRHKFRKGFVPDKSDLEEEAAERQYKEEEEE